MKYKALVENESSKAIKILRTDNGSKYTSDAFEGFLSLKEIKHQSIVSYNPQHNRVCERKNRTLMEMTHYLLFE